MFRLGDSLVDRSSSSRNDRTKCSPKRLGAASSESQAECTGRGDSRTKRGSRCRPGLSLDFILCRRWLLMIVFETTKTIWRRVYASIMLFLSLRFILSSFSFFDESSFDSALAFQRNKSNSNDLCLVAEILILRCSSFPPFIILFGLFPPFRSAHRRGEKVHFFTRLCRG